MQSGIIDAVAARIKQPCHKKGWSSYQLALSAAIPYSTVKDIFAGRSKSINIAHIKAIADAFDMDIATFFDTPEFRSLEQEIQ